MANNEEIIEKLKKWSKEKNKNTMRYKEFSDVYNYIIKKLEELDERNKVKELEDGVEIYIVEKIKESLTKKSDYEKAYNYYSVGKEFFEKIEKEEDSPVSLYKKNDYINKNKDFEDVIIYAMEVCFVDTTKTEDILKLVNMLNKNNYGVCIIKRDDNFKFILSKAIIKAIKNEDLKRINILGRCGDFNEQEKELLAKELIEAVEEGKGKTVIKILDDNKNMFDKEKITKEIITRTSTTISKIRNFIKNSEWDKNDETPFGKKIIECIENEKYSEVEENILEKLDKVKFVTKFLQECGLNNFNKKKQHVEEKNSDSKEKEYAEEYVEIENDPKDIKHHPKREIITSDDESNRDVDTVYQDIFGYLQQREHGENMNFDLLKQKTVNTIRIMGLKKRKEHQKVRVVDKEGGINESLFRKDK